jgi:hypothetical protein
MDPTVLPVERHEVGRSVEDEALGRATLAEAAAVVRRVGVQCPWVVAAWVSALELADVAERDAVQTRRWKYVRTVLRREVAPVLVA